MRFKTFSTQKRSKICSRQITKDPILAMHNKNNVMVNDKKETANFLNEQFSSLSFHEPTYVAFPDF